MAVQCTLVCMILIGLKVSLTHSACVQCRMLVRQTGLSESATCVVIAEEQLQRLAPLCPPACQLICLRAAAAPQQAALQHDARASADSISSLNDILRYVVTSHTAHGTSFVIGIAMKRQRALALAERGFFPIAPTDGLSFLPLDLSRDLGPQLQGPLHAILHKVCLLRSRGRPELECRWSCASPQATRFSVHRGRMSWGWELMGSCSSLTPLNNSSASRPRSPMLHSLTQSKACER